MAGRQDVGAKVARCLEEIGKFDVLVAGDAGDWRLARHIAACEGVDDLFAEAGFVIQHVMGNAKALGDPTGIVDILAGAAGALAMGGGAMVVKLQRDADDVIAFLLQKRCHNGGIDPAGHGHDHARVRRRPRQAEGVEGSRRSSRNRRRGGKAFHGFSRQRRKTIWRSNATAATRNRPRKSDPGRATAFVAKSGRTPCYG